MNHQTPLTRGLPPTFALCAMLACSAAFGQDPAAPADPEDLLEALRIINAEPGEDADFAPASGSDGFPPGEGLFAPEANEDTLETPAPAPFDPFAPDPGEVDELLPGIDPDALVLPVPDTAGEPPSPVGLALPEPETAILPDTTPMLGLPRTTDARLAIAGDRALASMALDLAGLAREIHAAGLDEAVLTLLYQVQPEGSPTAQRLSALFADLDGGAGSSSALGPNGMEEGLEAMIETVIAAALSEYAPGLIPAPGGAPAASPAAPQPAGPTDFEIIPVSGQIETEWGQTEKAIIQMQRRRHILWPGDTVEDPNGEPVTLVGVFREGAEDNPVHRIVVNHNGVEKRLRWHWENGPGGAR